MVKAIHAFLEFCFTARRDIHNTNTLSALDDALQRFHNYREIFRTTGVHEDFNLLWQHAMTHYAKLIRAFGAPNGLCSSIMESKHIKAVKEPWRCSSRFNALCQMLLTNQHLDKLAAACANFNDREMLQGTCLSAAWEQILHMYILFLLQLPFEPISVYLEMDIDPPSNGEDNNEDDDKNDNDDGNNDDDDNESVVDGPTVDTYVDLARTPRKPRILHCQNIF